VKWAYQLRASDDDRDWLTFRNLPTAEAQRMQDRLLADLVPRVSRLESFASGFGITSVGQADGLDALNDVVLEAIDQDRLQWRFLKAIVWDVALSIGSTAISRYPNALRWELASRFPKVVGYNSPVLTGYRGAEYPNYYCSVFVTIETHFWHWVRQHSGQADPEDRRLDSDRTLFSGVLRDAMNGAEGPPILPSGVPYPSSDLAAILNERAKQRTRKPTAS
jgi:hypothetical protein